MSNRELSTLAMHLGRACRTIRFFARMYAKKGGPESALSALLEKRDRKSTRLNSSHGYISYAVFCLKKKKNPIHLINQLIQVATFQNCMINTSQILFTLPKIFNFVLYITQLERFYHLLIPFCS